MLSSLDASTEMPASTAATTRINASPAVRVLILATLASVPFIAASILNVQGQRIVWDNLVALIGGL